MKRAQRVEVLCRVCGAIMRVTVAKSNRQFCTRKCQNEHFKISFAGANNPAYGRTYRTKASHPEWASSISKTSTERQVNAGEKNGMKRKEVSTRMGATRTQRFKDDPTLGENASLMMRQAWADGKYDGVAVGKCKWYDHVRPDGSVVKLQGTWEVAFARWLDASSLTYDTHRGRWNYVGRDGAQRSYYPDFYIHSWDTWVDVKGAFWGDEQATKLDYVRASNPDKCFIIANKQWLEEHRVDYLSVQHELLAQ